MLLVPGSQVRAVDARGGQVLATVASGHGLVGLQVDAALDLYLLDEAGGLSAWRLATHLAVVGR